MGRSVEGIEGGHIGCQGIEVSTASGLRCAERIRATAEVGVGHQTGSTCQGSNLPLEVLDLVEVVAPVQEALAGGPPTQCDCVAQALAEPGEVPGTPVAATVVVAARTTHVAISRQTRIPRIVEEL